MRSDLSIVGVSLAQNGQINPDPDGDGIVDLVAGVPVTASTTFAAQNLGTQSPFVPVTLNYQGYIENRTVDLSSGSAAVQATFIPIGSGLQTLSASIQAAQGETNLGNNTRTGQVRVRSQLKLVAEPLDGKSVENGPPRVVQVLPSLYACGRITETLRRPRLQIKCIDESSGQPVAVDGCSYRTHLEEGPYDGGHDKIHSEPRPLGYILPESAWNWTALPQAGSTIRFETPDIAGLVDFVIEGRSPSGEVLAPFRVRYQVKTPGFEPISVSGLAFDVESHSSGTHGTKAMSGKLGKLIERYIKNAQSAGISNPPILESEAASLPWGGLFDIDFDWLTPHCGHRDGITLDLSLSVFRNSSTEREKTLANALAKAVKEAGFDFTYAPESPNPPKGKPKPDHWHIRMK